MFVQFYHIHFNLIVDNVAYMNYFESACCNLNCIYKHFISENKSMINKHRHIFPPNFIKIIIIKQRIQEYSLRSLIILNDIGTFNKFMLFSDINITSH
jgi:hypothetical protein